MGERWTPRVIDVGGRRGPAFDNRALVIMALQDATHVRKRDRDLLLALAWQHDNSDEASCTVNILVRVSSQPKGAIFEGIASLIEAGFLGGVAMGPGPDNRGHRVRWAYGPRIDAVRSGR